MSKLGGDLEFAFKNDAGNFIPAGMLPINGVKGAPEPYPTGGIEVDGCAVELTFPPADDEDAFVGNILNHYAAMADRFSIYGKLVTVSSVEFDEAVLRMVPGSSQMGCDPDFNVWTGKENPKPRPKTPGFRTFGGHVHIENGNEALIKACDLILGMWSVCFDKDKERRSLYGKAGAFRFKPYGVEYRVLSNFWCNDEFLIRAVWRGVEAAKEIAHEVDSITKSLGGPEFIQEVINESQFAEAFKIRKTLGFRT